jgi:SpoVK/Ycf46/Vps4 family AAA+-type ATPase
MYHYIIKVPQSGEVITARETIVDRVEYYNDSSHYLLFDGGNELEQRFIMVSEKRVTKANLTELQNIFERTVTAETIEIKTIDRKTLRKIRTVKQLMVNNDYNGDQKHLLVTETADQLILKADELIGYTKFKEFYKTLADYIDRTAEMKAKCLYNTVLINKCGVCLETHTELLYSLFAAKGLLTEQVMLTGGKYEANRNEKNSGCVYIINDEWESDDDDELFRASEEVKLLKKIRKSYNIFITTMKPEQYAALSVLDCFGTAFPNTVIIDELTVDEKLEYICSVADEYGFAVDKKDFFSSRFMETAPLDKIETAVRNAVISKLTAKDKSFNLAIADIDTKVKKIEKISALAELERLVGLDGVKQSVKEIVNFLKKRGRNAVPCLHMAFLGNPGTCKTTVARIIARIFAETGVIKKNLLVETDREGLVGGYVGQTALKTKNKIESAMGGVLFIDEAYSLFAGDKIDYGHEAVATLVKAMEDKRDEFVCILAGYTKEMNAMLDMNPGLRDRVQFYIDFPNYTETELLQIFKDLCKESKYKLSKSAVDSLLDNFSRIIKAKSQNFSNGRLVRKLFERVRMKQALRTSSNIITDTDIKAVFNEPDIAVLIKGNNRATIGFNG